MRTLALDLGTHTGYAYDTLAGFTCGTKLLATAKALKEAKKLRLDRRCDIRVVAFWEWLTALHAAHHFEAVIFEDVTFGSYQLQMQLWSSLRAVVWLAVPGALIEAVPVSTLKKQSTGTGTADKAQMAAALKQQHPELYNAELGDDAVDAAWLWVWGQKNLGRLAK